MLETLGSSTTPKRQTDTLTWGPDRAFYFYFCVWMLRCDISMAFKKSRIMAGRLAGWWLCEHSIDTTQPNKLLPKGRKSSRNYLCHKHTSGLLCWTGQTTHLFFGLLERGKFTINQVHAKLKERRSFFVCLFVPSKKAAKLGG